MRRQSEKEMHKSNGLFCARLRKDVATISRYFCERDSLGHVAKVLLCDYIDFYSLP